MQVDPARNPDLPDVLRHELIALRPAWSRVGSAPMTSPRILTVGGLPITVFGLSSSAPSPKGLAVLFLCHGRFGSAADPKIAAFATSLVAHARAQLGTSPGKDLLVVTFDQRNHGERVVDKARNKGWKDRGEVAEVDNVSHAVDM